jgi:hypothetical protein
VGLLVKRGAASPDTRNNVADKKRAQLFCNFLRIRQWQPKGSGEGLRIGDGG